MKIVYGGAFNPPTIAHIHIIEHLLALYQDAGMIIVPVGDDYKKKELVSFHHRYHMLMLATRHLHHVTISKIEHERPYQGTLATLKELEAIDSELAFVLGSDNLVNFDQWINYRDILKSYPILVVNRKGYLTKDEADQMFKDIPHRFIFIDVDFPIASSQIRQDINTYKDQLDLDVFEYIKNHHLYEVNNYV